MSPRAAIGQRVLASLFEAVETQTPYGGLAVSYEPLGHAWLRLGARRRRERSGPDGLRGVETASAETRADARLSVGRVLRFLGADWRIAQAECVGGRGLLQLERMR